MSTGSMKLNLYDAQATEALGTALARALPEMTGGAVIYLQGELGAGKTTAVRSLLRSMGVTAPVRSPTYTLVDTYRAAGLTFVHVDLYRLVSATEIEELALRDVAGAETLMLIEWAEKGARMIPTADLIVALAYAADSRTVYISTGSPQGIEWLANLALDSSLVPYVPNLT
jgi:tRNA threonylcarbamoyladenosine biosynthesis protein TsaE